DHADSGFGEQAEGFVAGGEDPHTGACPTSTERDAELSPVHGRGEQARGREGADLQSNVLAATVAPGRPPVVVGGRAPRGSRHADDQNHAGNQREHRWSPLYAGFGAPSTDASKMLASRSLPT